MTLQQALSSFDEKFSDGMGYISDSNRIIDLHSFITEVWLASRESVLEEAEKLFLAEVPIRYGGRAYRDYDDDKYGGIIYGRLADIEILRALKK